MVTARPALAVDGLAAGYWVGRPVFEQASFALAGPGLHHLRAANGGGKSTLFEVLAGFLEPMHGTVEVCGRRVIAGERVRHLRLQRSDHAFVPGLSISDQLYLYVVRYGADRGVVYDLAIQLGLREHLGKAPEALSTGMLKKAWFAANAAGDESVLCVDEPFNGVDDRSTEVIADRLRLLAAERLVLVTSHHLPDALRSVGAAVPLTAHIELQEVAA